MIFALCLPITNAEQQKTTIRKKLVWAAGERSKVRKGSAMAAKIEANET
jgi:hypothetical protein